MQVVAKISNDEPAGGFCPACLAHTAASSGRCAACDRPRPDAGWPRDPLLGRVVKSKYRLVERLGAGGFGLVFRAVQVQGELELGEVVVKLLLPEKAADEESRRRFFNEARAARSVRSPHVVKVFDLDFDDDGQPFLVMEYLHGESLQRLMEREKPLAPERALRLAMQVADALDECHAAGIVHRDLKPENLLLQRRVEELVKVLDFGVARVPSARAVTTRTPIGTPRYMAPEQIRGEHVDGGADIFALGVILYECLCGAPPIDADTPDAYWRLNVDATPTPLRERRPDLPEALERLVGRMMAKRRADRPPSMADVEHRLRAIGVNEGWLSAGGRRGSASTVDSPGGESRRRAGLTRRARVALFLMAAVTVASLVALGLVARHARVPDRGQAAVVPCPLPPPASAPASLDCPTPPPILGAASSPAPAASSPAGHAGRAASAPASKRAHPRALRAKGARPRGTDEWGRAVGGL